MPCRALTVSTRRRPKNWFQNETSAAADAMGGAAASSSVASVALLRPLQNEAPAMERTGGEYAVSPVAPQDVPPILPNDARSHWHEPIGRWGARAPAVHHREAGSAACESWSNNRLIFGKEVMPRFWGAEAARASTGADRHPFDYVEKAKAAGIVTGVTATTFMPWNDITRVQLALMIVRIGGETLAPATTSPSRKVLAG